jgi:hypothetical protein
MMGADMSVAHRQSILHLTSHANIPAELTKRKPEFMSKTVAPLLFLPGWTMSTRMALGFVFSLSVILQVGLPLEARAHDRTIRGWWWA